MAQFPWNIGAETPFPTLRCRSYEMRMLKGADFSLTSPSGGIYPTERALSRFCAGPPRPERTRKRGWVEDLNWYRPVTLIWQSCSASDLIIPGVGRACGTRNEIVCGRSNRFEEKCCARARAVRAYFLLFSWIGAEECEMLGGLHTPKGWAGLGWACRAVIKWLIEPVRACAVCRLSTVSRDESAAIELTNKLVYTIVV